MVKKITNADQTDQKRIVARRTWRLNIYDEVVVKNGRLETKWTVWDNITRNEYPKINTHMTTSGVRGFDFKDILVSTRKAAQDELYDEMTAYIPA